MGFFKAEGLISGWVGKIRNNLYFRITRQYKLKTTLKFSIHDIFLYYGYILKLMLLCQMGHL
jgi:hypothetical protein